MALTDAQKRIYASAPTGEYVRDTLTISHSGMTKTYYITTWPRPFSGYVGEDLVEFEPFAFRFVLPKNDGRGQQDMQLVFSNATPEIRDELENTITGVPEAIKVEYRPYIGNDPQPQIDPPLSLYISKITMNVREVSGVATRKDIINAPFPRRDYRIGEFPGLKR